MKRISLLPLILIFVLALGCFAPAAYAVEDPQVGAGTVVLADMATGEIIYSKNADAVVSPASLTKILTVTIAIEAIEAGRCSLDEVIVAPDECWEGMDEMSSNAGIIPGEELTMENLLYCAMLGSANEACNTLAVHISGSIQAFCDQMNIRARELGCTNTVFVDPNGLSSSDLTTAKDFFLITQEAAKHDLFMTICNTNTYIVPATNRNNPRTLENSNALTSPNSVYALDGRYLYPYASGIKTGYTSAAGYCLISTAEKDGLRLVNIVMGCNGPLNAGLEEYRNFADSIILYDWAFDNFSYETIIEPSLAVYKANVQYGEGDGTVTLRPQTSVELLVPNDFDRSSVELEVHLQKDKLVAPIESGTVLGTADVKINGEVRKTIKLVNTASVELSRSQYIKQRTAGILRNGFVKALIIILIVLLVIYTVLVVRYRTMRRKHLREKRKEELRRRAEREKMKVENYHRTPGEPTLSFPKVEPIDRSERPSVEIAGEEDI